MHPGPYDPSFSPVRVASLFWKQALNLLGTCALHFNPLNPPHCPLRRVVLGGKLRHGGQNARPDRTPRDGFDPGRGRQHLPRVRSRLWIHSPLSSLGPRRFSLPVDSLHAFQGRRPRLQPPGPDLPCAREQLSRRDPGVASPVLGPGFLSAELSHPFHLADPLSRQGRWDRTGPRRPLSVAPCWASRGPALPRGRVWSRTEPPTVTLCRSPGLGSSGPPPPRRSDSPATRSCSLSSDNRTRWCFLSPELSGARRSVEGLVPAILSFGPVGFSSFCSVVFVLFSVSVTHLFLRSLGRYLSFVWVPPSPGDTAVSSGSLLIYWPWNTWTSPSRDI